MEGKSNVVAQIKQKLRRSQSLVSNNSSGAQSISKQSEKQFIYLIDTLPEQSDEEGVKIQIPDQMRTVRFKRKIPVHGNSLGIRDLFPSDRDHFLLETVKPCEEPTPSLQTYARKNYKKFLPSVSELLFGSQSIGLETSDQHDSNSSQMELLQTESVPSERKGSFGMWDGVVARNLMQIFGGVMFLRLGMTFGQTGLALGTAMILGCSVMTVITALSLSAIATNGIPHSGGIYYLLSRSLGPKFGGAIGTLMIVGYASDLSIFTVTFAEALLDHIHAYLPDFTIINVTWDMKLIELFTLLILMILVCCGVETVIMIFSIFLVIMLLCLGSIYLGAFITTPKPHTGFVGASVATLYNNLWPRFYEGNSLMSVLILFFPAMSGFTAAGTLYSELRTPEISFPRGTLIAIGISACIYIVSGWILGSSCVREIDGDQGLVFRKMIMADVSLWSPLVYFGIYASTLTSALGALMTGPRILFAMCQDQLFPTLNSVLNKFPVVRTSLRHSKIFISLDQSTNPVSRPSLNRCLLFFCIIPVFVALFGNPNSNARLSSGANLLLFMLINYAVFAASFAATPAWRPTFKYSNKWISLVGFFLCAGSLMFVNAFASITCIITGVILYKYLAVTTARNRYRYNWGSTGETIAFTTAIKSLNNLKRTPQTSQTYRPNFLILSGPPGERPDLIKATDLLRAGHGLSIYASVIIYPDINQNKVRYMKKLVCCSSARQRLQDHLSIDLRVKGFASVIVASSLTEAVRSLIMTSGVTPHLSPNVVCLGFKNNWRHQSQMELEEYIEVLQTSLALNAGFAIVRNAKLFRCDAEGTNCIDVWWLFDDGGLTVLLGYLLTKSPQFKKKNVKMRLMTVTTSSTGREIARMYGLLKQLRIPAEVVGLNSIDAHGNLHPSQHFIEKFKALTNIHELEKLTLKILHVSDLIQKHSSSALAIAVTVPIPSIAYSSTKFMAWMECLSCIPVTTFLLRGNQVNVLSTEL